MKIFQVGQVNPWLEEQGGIEVYVKSLSRELREKGHEVTLAGWTDRDDKMQGFIPIVKSDTMRGARFSLALLMNARKLDIPDDAVIHVHRPDHILPFMHRKNRIVCTLHGAHIKNVRLKKGPVVASVFSVFQKMALRRADSIISVSDDTKRFFLSMYPFIAGKVTTVPPGVEPIFSKMSRTESRKQFSLSLAEKIVLYAGRLEKEKRVDFMISQARGRSYRLAIAGAGREEENLRRLAGGADNITFLGKVNHSQLPALISSADVLSLFSFHEGMPTIILESMACGVPVVSSDAGDIPKVVVDGKTGFIAGEKDYQEKIQKILSGDKDYSGECMKAAEEFSWDRISEKILEAYRGK